jgi:hypothetical protein
VVSQSCYKSGQVRYHTLQHAAHTLLGGDVCSDHHTAVGDCINSVRIYSRFIARGKQTLQKARKTLQYSGRPAESVVRRNNYVIDGVCMAGYYADKCTCGQPSKSG